MALGRGPASEAEYQDELHLLTKAMDRLPDEYRDVLVLRHLDGLSFHEVARRMDRSTGAVRMLWLRAIEKLRHVLVEQSSIEHLVREDFGSQDKSTKRQP